MIPYVQPIFIPDENHLDLNTASIRSFGEYIKKYPYDLKCVFGGYAKNKRSCRCASKLNEYVERATPPNFEYILWSENEISKRKLQFECADKIEEIEDIVG